jgi:RimJ/RimL family protein N-acetyltransferase
MSVLEYARIYIGSGSATLTPLLQTDITAIIDFWHHGGADHDFLGIDPLMLGSPDDTRKRFESALITGDPDQSNTAFAIRLDERLIGYSLLNRYTPEINHSHWHIIDPNLRGAGISSALYPYRIDTYFRLYPIRRLIHQTRTRNLAVNRMLDKYLPVAETRYIGKPDGVALPGEFHLRYVTAADIPGFFDRAAQTPPPQVPPQTQAPPPSSSPADKHR